MRRAVRILWLLFPMMAPPAFAAITVDVGPLTISKTDSAPPFNFSSVTTAQSNEVIGVALVCAGESAIFGTNDTDISVSGGGLTWTKRVSHVYTSGSFDGFFGTQVWTAIASSTISGQTISINSVSGNLMTCAANLVTLEGACTSAFGGTGGYDDPDGTNNSAVSATINVVDTGSYLIGAFGDGNSSGGNSALANTTMDVAFGDGLTGTTDSAGHKTTTTSATGNTTIGNSTVDTFNATAALEILVSTSSSCTAGSSAKPSRSLLGVGS